MVEDQNGGNWLGKSIQFVRRYKWWFLALLIIPVLLLIGLIVFVPVAPEPPFVYELF